MGWGSIIGKGIMGKRPMTPVGGGIQGGLGGSTAASKTVPVPVEPKKPMGGLGRIGGMMGRRFR